MKVEQRRWNKTEGWKPKLLRTFIEFSQLIFIFSVTSILKEQRLLKYLKESYPHAYILGCLSAGDFLNTQVSNSSMVITAVSFEHTELKGMQLQTENIWREIFTS